MQWNIQLQLLFDTVPISLKGSSIRLSYLNACFVSNKIKKGDIVFSHYVFELILAPHGPQGYRIENPVYDVFWNWKKSQTHAWLVGFGLLASIWEFLNVFSNFCLNFCPANLSNHVPCTKTRSNNNKGKFEQKTLVMIYQAKLGQIKYIKWQQNFWNVTLISSSQNSQTHINWLDDTGIKLFETKAYTYGSLHIKIDLKVHIIHVGLQFNAYIKNICQISFMIPKQTKNDINNICQISFMIPKQTKKWTK